MKKTVCFCFCDKCDAYKPEKAIGWRRIALDVDGSEKPLTWFDACPRCMLDLRTFLIYQIVKKQKSHKDYEPYAN